MSETEDVDMVLERLRARRDRHRLLESVALDMFSIIKRVAANGPPRLRREARAIVMYVDGQISMNAAPSPLEDEPGAA